jgi:hypothetical protein
MPGGGKDFDDYMTATSGGTNTQASSNYGTPPPQSNPYGGGSYGGGEPEAYVPYNEPAYGGYSNAQEQYAASLQDYNQMYGIAGGGVGLGSSGYMQYTNVPDVYYSTYLPGTQGYSPTGFQTIAGPGALYENGELVEGFVDRSIFNPYGGGFGGGGGGGYGYRYGGGGGGQGGGGGFSYNMGPQGQVRQRGRVGPGSLQEQVNQAFLSGGKPFAKGGIVSLVED